MRTIYSPEAMKVKRNQEGERLSEVDNFLR